MYTVKTITQALEQKAPLAWQESYDNSGLQVGDPNMQVKGVLLCLDITEAVLEEALAKKCNLIIAQHPLLFSGLSYHGLSLRPLVTCPTGDGEAVRCPGRPVVIRPSRRRRSPERPARTHRRRSLRRHIFRHHLCHCGRSPGPPRSPAA